MKIVIVGAAGAVGRWVAADLASCGEVDELVLSDFDVDRATQLAAELSEDSPPTVIDGGDQDSVRRALSGADLLVNCASFMTAGDILELAIDEQIDYLDLMSSPAADARARAADAGIVAVTGVGTSPGMTNVLVRHAANEFDALEEVHISFAISRPHLAASKGGLDTVLWELGRHCPDRVYFADGALRPAGPREGSRTIDFGERAGVREVYYVPHPETTSLARNFPSLRFCAVRGTWHPQVMAEIAVLNKYGLLDADTHEQTKELLWAKLGTALDPTMPHYWGLNVEILASANGTRVKRVYEITYDREAWRDQPVTRGTAVAAAVCSQLVARNARSFNHAGILDPECFFDPEEFLTAVRERGTLDARWSDTAI